MNELINNKHRNRFGFTQHHKAGSVNPVSMKCPERQPALKPRPLDRGAGFTVMETVVVMGIFVIAVTACLGIFVRSNTVQKRTANMQRTLADARYVLEVIAREIRLGNIDYDYYGGTLPAMPLTDPGDVLALIDADDNQIFFQRADAGSGRYVIQISTDGGSNWFDITPDNINITRLDFYISPDENPFEWQAGGYPNNEQPIVTIVLETESTFQYGPSITTQKANFQTTVTSRKYVR